MVGYVLVLFGVAYFVAAGALGYLALSIEPFSAAPQFMILAMAAGALLSGCLLVGFGELITDVRALRKKLVSDFDDLAAGHRREVAGRDV